MTILSIQSKLVNRKQRDDMPHFPNSIIFLLSPVRIFTNQSQCIVSCWLVCRCTRATVCPIGYAMHASVFWTHGKVLRIVAMQRKRNNRHSWTFSRRRNAPKRRWTAYKWRPNDSVKCKRNGHWPVRSNNESWKQHWHNRWTRHRTAIRITTALMWYAFAVDLGFSRIGKNNVFPFFSFHRASSRKNRTMWLVI